MKNACTGKCCSVFNYSVGLDVLKARTDDESKFLADMLIELTPDEAVARAERFEVTPPDGFDLRSWAEAAPSYTCRHWDEETMLCGVYEDRPRMCRDYPYAGKCQHDCNCTFRAPGNIRTRYSVTHVRSAVRRAEA